MNIQENVNTIEKMIEELRLSLALDSEKKLVFNDEVMFDNVVVITDWNIPRDFVVGCVKNAESLIAKYDTKGIDCELRVIGSGEFINQY